MSLQQRHDGRGRAKSVPSAAQFLRRARATTHDRGSQHAPDITPNDPLGGLQSRPRRGSARAVTRAVGQPRPGGPGGGPDPETDGHRQA